MPEAYTHVRIARAALRAAGLRAGSAAALAVGANGPDPLFAGGMPRVHGPWPMQELGVRMHAEACGVFLQALVYYARTPAQRSYALGFLAHNAADALLHPYVAACAAEGGAFAGPEGHARCESALDTYFYKTDKGEAAVQADDAVPALNPAETAEVCALLRRALEAVYGQRFSALELSDMLDTFRLAHRFCSGAGMFRRALGAAVSRMFIHRPGYAAAHMTPAKVPEGGFATVWIHPETKQEVHAGPNALALAAMRRAAASMTAAARYWRGELTLAKAAAVFGNISYNTGLVLRAEPVPKPKPQAEKLQTEKIQAEKLQAEKAQLSAPDAARKATPQKPEEQAAKIATPQTGAAAQAPSQPKSSLAQAAQVSEQSEQGSTQAEGTQKEAVPSEKAARKSTDAEQTSPAVPVKAAPRPLRPATQADILEAARRAVLASARKNTQTPPAVAQAGQEAVQAAAQKAVQAAAAHAAQGAAVPPRQA